MNDKSTQAVLAAVLMAALGFGVGYIVADESSEDSSSKSVTTEMEVHDTEDHSHDDDDMTHMMHEQFEVTDGVPAPTVELAVTADSKAGYNVKISTTNFEFAPENASSDHVDGEGHSHIYVNGEKISRVYSEDYFLGDLEPGDEVRVTLNTNDHKDYVVDGAVVEATAVAE